MTNILENTDHLLSKARTLIEETGIDTDDIVQADMLCYRVESVDRYEVVKSELSRLATLLDESEVSGRIISIFELLEPIVADNWRVSYVELPQPKANNRYAEGWEHAQFVTRVEIGRFAAKYPDVEFEVGGNDLNRLLEISNGKVAVKFHDKSIGAVVEMEKS